MTYDLIMNVGLLKDKAVILRSDQKFETLKLNGNDDVISYISQPLVKRLGDY